MGFGSLYNWLTITTSPAYVRESGLGQHPQGASPALEFLVPAGLSTRDGNKGGSLWGRPCARRHCMAGARAGMEQTPSEVHSQVALYDSPTQVWLDKINNIHWTLLLSLRIHGQLWFRTLNITKQRYTTIFPLPVITETQTLDRSGKVIRIFLFNPVGTGHLKNVYF